MKKGIFITFEGPEGSGKSTHMARLAPYLKKKGYSILMTREPGGTALSKEFRRILLNTGKGLTSLTELFLYEADRTQHVEEIVLPALRLGKIVLCDRYTDSTLAYQGYGRKLNIHIIQTLNRIASQEQAPHLTILLDLPVEKGLERAGQRARGHDRLESAGLLFHRRVRKGYLALAAKDRRRFRVIAQQEDLEETQRLIRSAVDHFLESPQS